MRVFGSGLNTRPILTYALSLLFALVFQLPDWPGIFEAIYGYPMIDRLVYENKLLDYDLPVDYIFDPDLLTYFTREWLWNWSIANLNRELGWTPDQIFLIVTILVLWRFTFEIATRAGWIYVLLLVNPLVVDFAFSQLRLAFAIAVLSFFWRRQRGKVATIIAYLVCCSIHTAIILFAAMHLAAHYFASPARRFTIFLCLTGVLISILIAPLRETILGAVGDRRAESPEMESSLLYLSFWIVMWALLLARQEKTVTSLDGRYALVILSIAAANLITGGYSTRFIVAGFPSLIIAMRNWPSKPVGLPVLLFLPYAGTQWLYWLRVV